MSADATAVAPTRPTARQRLLVLAFRSLRRLPPRLVEETLGAGAFLDGVLNPSKLRQALDWAGSHRRTLGGRWGLAIALLGNRGRFAATAHAASLTGPDAFRRRALLHGREHLDAARRRGSTLLLGFHLGPGAGRWVLLTHGYTDIITVGRRLMVWPPPRPEWDADAAAPLVQWVPHDLPGQVARLYQARKLLLAGRTVRFFADGLTGRVAFPIRVPGAEFIIRGGWWILRRETGATCLPVLEHRDGDGIVVAIHPPLPPPAPDREQDLAGCRSTLAPLLEDYVSRHPEQCPQLVFQPPLSADG